MVFRLMTGFSLVALSVLTGLATGTLAFADSGAALVKANLQGNSRILPHENVVTFVNSDRRVRLQLESLTDSSTPMVGASVTVISPAGEATQMTADAQGMVILSDVQTGLYAVVSAGATGHVAVPLALREVPEEGDDGDASVVANPRISTVRLPLIVLDSSEIVRVVNSFLPPARDATLDSQLITSSEVLRAYRYRVQLTDSGRLEGRIYSLLTGAQARASLPGNNLMFYSGNRLVARATTDEEGRFTAENLRPGIHGVIAVGPAGYGAFAFDVFSAGELVDQAAASEAMVRTSSNGATLVNLNQPPASVGALPVVVIPPAMTPPVVATINGATPPGAGLPLDPTVPGFAPVPGGGFAGGAGGGFGGGGGGLGGAAGGLGGAGGLLALGGVAAAVAAVASDSDDRPIVLPPVATPAEPGPPSP